MKLHYFKDPNGNFGDDLNPWLWPKFLPDVLDDNADEWLIGIGTLINHRLPQAPVKHVMGSGVGYGELPHLDARWHFHALRGFESAQRLGVSDACVITDAAVLVRRVSWTRQALPQARHGLMFTGRSLENYDWERVCREADVAFISCHWSVERVLSEMQRCDVLLTEAMHGAIVADALRVPWIPVNCSDEVLGFKWRDWLSSLRLPYEPSRITPLYDPRRRLGPLGPMKHAVKRGLGRVGLASARWGDLPPPSSNQSDLRNAVAEIRQAALRRPFLSDEALLESHTQRYVDLLGQLNHLAASR
jgi:succinoglycan biosynthesis protein ExoV